MIYSFESEVEENWLARAKQQKLLTPRAMYNDLSLESEKQTRQGFQRNPRSGKTIKQNFLEGLTHDTSLRAAAGGKLGRQN